MSRLRADCLLLFVAMIWGTGFIAQKGAFQHIGAYSFVAARFFLAALSILPMAVLEWRPHKHAIRQNAGLIFLMCLSFCVAAVLQQAGIGKTSITNAGFLTGLYVVFAPFVCWIADRKKLSVWILPAAFLSIAGTWFLSGHHLQKLSSRDALCWSNLHLY